MPPKNYLYIIIAVLAMMVGLYLIIQWFLSRGQDESEIPTVAYDKNGIPIIPRHERDLFDENDLDDAVAGEMTIAPDRSHLQPVIDNDDSTDNNSTYNNSLYTKENDYAEDELYTGEDDEHDHQYIDKAPMTHLSQSDGDDYQEGRLSHVETSQNGTNDQNQAVQTRGMSHGDTQDNEEDFFSTLASATENFMPVIETAEEPEFNENSPLLDQHLLSQADYEQNSPLNNAEENINITLVPKHSSQSISGKTILSLVEQYGLRYGAMNMFHRYENKDGTGILWFSMMGMTKEGIAPFDLNSLPTSEYKGLVLFLSLPHPKALQGFDSMMSIVGLISKQLDTHILDENNDPLTRERKQQLRTQVQEYQYAN